MWEPSGGLAAVRDLSLLVSYIPLALRLSCKKSWHGVVRHRKRLSGALWCSRIGCTSDAAESSCTWHWEHAYSRRSHNHARVNAAASCVGVGSGRASSSSGDAGERASSSGDVACGGSHWRPQHSRAQEERAAPWRKIDCAARCGASSPETR